MITRNILLTIALFVGLLPGQAITTVRTQPDCIVPLFFTFVPGASTVLDNRQTGCQGWVLMYNTFNTVSSISIVVQSAPTNAAGGAGAFVTYTGTTVSGTNPNTTTGSGSWTGTGYVPWIRANVTAVTGSGTGNGVVSGVLYGWRNAAVAISSSGGGGGGGTQYTNGSAVATPTGTVALGYDGANVRAIRTGATGIQEVNCVAGCGASAGGANTATLSAALTITPGAATTLQLIPATPGQSNRIATLVAGLGAANTATFSIVAGTGVNCATGTTTLVSYSNSPVAVSYPVQGWLTAPVSAAVCIRSGSATTTNWDIGVVYGLI